MAGDIVGDNIFAHIRLATVGEINLNNCQPFTGKDANGCLWMLMHNGTVFSYPELEKYVAKQNGSTDSERILLLIIDKINEFEKAKKSPSTISERFNLLSDLISKLAEGNKINIMIYDGDMTYIHSNMKDSMYYVKNDESITVSSTPLDEQKWMNVRLNRLFGLKKGEVIFESEPHSNEFIFTEKHLKAIEEFLKTLDDEKTAKLLYDHMKVCQEGFK